VTTCELAVLPPSFYDATPLLTAIRRKANHVMTGPDAILMACLARVAAATTPNVVVDYQRCPLNLYVAIIGPPGAGKSKAATAARELLDDLGIDADWVPVPSGEGLCDVFLGKTDKETHERPQLKQTAFVYVDEGQQLHKTGQREGSTILDVARSMWAAQPVGTMNADPDRRRQLRANAVRIGFVVGYQPDVALSLFRGADVGDPQRFVFVSCLAPHADRVRPPDVPALDWQPNNRGRSLRVPQEIAAFLADNEWRVATGQRTVDPLEVHDLQNQLRVAALLTLFHDPDADAVRHDMWNAAAAILELSRENRRRLAEYEHAKADIENTKKLERDIANDRTKRVARETFTAAERVCNRIVGQVTRGPMTQTQLTRFLGRDRYLSDAAVQIGVERGQIVVVDTGNGREYRLGQ
jgi:hypothetical protein